MNQEPVPSAPLTGMRVVDLSQQLPGPYATMLLAGLGAHVTKIEPPGGDAARRIDPAMFERVSVGKTTVRLDLKAHDDRDALHDMVRGADVLVEGFRPGVTRRLGCDFETLRRLNSRLVYCSISGFGQSGPAAARPTHDLSLQAIAGALPPDAAVDVVGVPWVDLGVATTAAFLVAAHWRRAEAIHLDLAMLDVADAWAGIKPSAVHRKEPTYGTFATSDGSEFALALLEDDMWQRLCQAFGIEEWATALGLAHYEARVTQQALVRQRVQGELGRRTAAQVAALAVEFDLPLDQVRDPTSAAQTEPVSWRREISVHGGLLPLGPGVGKPLAPLTEQ